MVLSRIPIFTETKGLQRTWARKYFYKVIFFDNSCLNFSFCVKKNFEALVQGESQAVKAKKNLNDLSSFQILT